MRPLAAMPQVRMSFVTEVAGEEVADADRRIVFGGFGGARQRRFTARDDALDEIRRDVEGGRAPLGGVEHAEAAAGVLGSGCRRGAPPLFWKASTMASMAWAIWGSCGVMESADFSRRSSALMILGEFQSGWGVLSIRAEAGLGCLSVGRLWRGLALGFVSGQAGA